MEYPHPAGPGSWLQVLQVLRQGVLLDVLLDVPAREMRLQVLLHHEVQGGLGEVLGDATSTVGVRDLGVLQVHSAFAHILIEQDGPIMTSVEPDGELAAPAVVLHADGAALLRRPGGRRLRHLRTGQPLGPAAGAGSARPGTERGAGGRGPARERRRQAAALKLTLGGGGPEEGPGDQLCGHVRRAASGRGSRGPEQCQRLVSRTQLGPGRAGAAER